MLNQIEKNANFEIKIKDSKFIGYSFKVSSKDEVKKYIEKISSEYKRATHICWAYRIYSSEGIVGYNSDAGEPRGSAGSPIQSTLENLSLVNTLCIVVRYFGGTKLGIGGLIRAYSSTAKKTIKKAGIKEFQPVVSIAIKTPHNKYSNIIGILNKNGLSFSERYNESGATFFLSTSVKQKNSLLAELKLFDEIKVKISD